MRAGNLVSGDAGHSSVAKHGLLPWRFLRRQLVNLTSCPLANPFLRADNVGKTEPLFQLKITLEDIEPLIWRQIQTHDCSLAELHEIIQTCMGWEGEAGPRSNGGPVDLFVSGLGVWG